MLLLKERFVEKEITILALGFSLYGKKTRKIEPSCTKWKIYVSRRVVSRPGCGGRGLQTLCIKIGYSEPTRVESPEGS